MGNWKMTKYYDHATVNHRGVEDALYEANFSTTCYYTHLEVMVQKKKLSCVQWNVSRNSDIVAYEMHFKTSSILLKENTLPLPSFFYSKITPDKFLDIETKPCMLSEIAS